jgi:DNA-binding transcriptional LysR family regulator
MDIARLKALKELASRRTIAAVANALCLTPSAVSQQISHLEDEVGLKLIERQGRGVKLTHAGELLVAHTGRMLHILDEARSDMARLKEVISGELRIAAFPTVACALLLQVIKSLQVSHPCLDLVLNELEPAEGLAALGSWNADLALVDDLYLKPLGPYKSVERVHVLDDTLHALLPDDHHLAGRSSLAIADLKHERWALDSAASFYAEFLLDLCHRAGFDPKVNASCCGSEMVLAMVSSGCSVTVIPGLRLAQPLEHVVAVKILPEIGRRIFVAFRKGDRKHPAIQLCVAQIRLAAAALPTVR